MTESESWKINKNKVLDIVFPRRCAVCDEPVDEQGKGVCRACAGKISYIHAPFCMKCGKQLQEEKEEYCADCRKKKHTYIQGTALYDYCSMADSIFRFKYAGRQEYALFYGQELFERKMAWIRVIKPDGLVPVPVHRARKRMRGYNQAELIAKAFSTLSGIPVYDNLVMRTRKTGVQKNLSRKQRQNNLKKAFKIMQNDVKLSTIVIIDDIYTTGSTIDAVSAVLYEAGAEKVYFMALAAGRGL